MNGTKHGKVIERKVCVVIFSATSFQQHFLFYEEMNENCIVIYAHVIKHCRAFFLLLLLRIRESTPADLKALLAQRK
jgi:hypothetical protein